MPLPPRRPVVTLTLPSKLIRSSVGASGYSLLSFITIAQVAHEIWHSQDLTLTDCHDLDLRSSVGDSQHSLSVLSKLFTPFMRHRGNKICLDVRTDTDELKTSKCLHRHCRVVKIYNNMKIKKCSKAGVWARPLQRLGTRTYGLTVGCLWYAERPECQPQRPTQCLADTHTHTHTARHTFMGHVITKGKGKEAYLYRAFYILWILWISQSAQAWITPFYLQITPCLPFLRKRSPDGATHNWGSRYPIAAYCSMYPPRRDERLSWPGWLTYSGRPTHISGHQSATGGAQDRESSLANDRRSTTVPRNQPLTSVSDGPQLSSSDMSD